MATEKSPLSGGTPMLILNLLNEKEMYGYQIIEELARRSDNTFSLKAGTLYPLLHGFEEQGLVTSHEKSLDSARVRKYYRITPKGKQALTDKKSEWRAFSAAVNQVLEGGNRLAAAY